MTTQPLLSAQGLCKTFGGVKAVQQAGIEVATGSITGLIGRMERVKRPSSIYYLILFGQILVKSN